MPGMIIPVFTRRTFDFDHVQSRGSVEFVMMNAIDVTDYTEGTLLVRVHASDVAPDATIEVIARATAPTDEQPEADFVGARVATVTIDHRVIAPTLVRAAFETDPGWMVTITVRGTQASAAPVSCSAELSADLVVKF